MTLLAFSRNNCAMVVLKYCMGIVCMHDENTMNFLRYNRKETPAVAVIMLVLMGGSSVEAAITAQGSQAITSAFAGFANWAVANAKSAAAAIGMTANVVMHAGSANLNALDITTTTAKPSNVTLSRLKRGQNWRYIANRSELSSNTTPNDLKWLTEPLVPSHRIPLEDSLRNSQGVSKEEWKRYLGKLIERELGQPRGKVSRDSRVTKQDEAEIANRPESQIPPAAQRRKANSGLRYDITPKGEVLEKDWGKCPSASDQTKLANTTEIIAAKTERRQDKLESPSSWEWVAGFFDGEGSILLEVRKYSIGMEVTFSQKYSPLLDSVQEFLRNEGIKSSTIYRRGTASSLSIHSTEDVKSVLEGMLPHLRLKENQAKAALDYLEDRINGKELVRIFNQEVEAGRRSGNLRAIPDQPLSRSESIRESREAQMKNAHHALHKPLDRLDYLPEV